MWRRLSDRITREYLVTHSDNPPEFTPETIGYIKSYLEPHLSELNAIEDGDFLPLINEYPQRMKTDIIETFRRKGYALSAADRAYNNKYGIQRTAEKIMDVLMDHIIFGDNDETFNNTDVVDPWSVEIQFRASEEQRQLFNLQPLTDDEEYDRVPITVPVDVIIDGRKHTHRMSSELVLGIIAYYRAFGLQHPLSMYGGRFVYETEQHVPLLVGHTPHAGYTVQVGTTQYEFGKPEFMQGLLTAHSWVSKADPHTVITNLRHYQPPQHMMGLPTIEGTAVPYQTRVIDLTY